jgi:hypothetical protein
MSITHFPRITNFDKNVNNVGVIPLTINRVTRILEDKTQFAKKLNRILHDPNRLYDGNNEGHFDKLPVLKAERPR